MCGQPLVGRANRQARHEQGKLCWKYLCGLVGRLESSQLLKLKLEEATNSSACDELACGKTACHKARIAEVALCPVNKVQNGGGR